MSRNPENHAARQQQQRQAWQRRRNRSERTIATEAVPGEVIDEDGKAWITAEKAEADGCPRELLQMWSDQPVFVPEAPHDRFIRRTVVMRLYARRVHLAWVARKLDGEVYFHEAFADDLKNLGDDELRKKAERFPKRYKETGIRAQFLAALFLLAEPDLQRQACPEGFLDVLGSDLDKAPPMDREIVEEWDRFHEAEQSDEDAILCHCECPMWQKEHDDIWECTCSCGKVRKVCGHCLREGRRKGCGTCGTTPDNSGFTVARGDGA
jgi:hypothetical protein